MSRKLIDCRDFPSESKCTIAIAADTEDEILDVAVAHAVKKHGHADTAELRSDLRKGIKEMALT
jgi:predicted small metal-binding protein